MKPKSISYSESKESFDITTGLKSWRKAGVEIELDDAYSVEESFSKAKEFVLNALGIDITIRNGTPIFPQEFTITQPLPTIDYSSKERTEQAIQDCKTPHELDLLMGDIAKHGLVPQFLEKKKQLK